MGGGESLFKMYSSTALLLRSCVHSPHHFNSPKLVECWCPKYLCTDLVCRDVRQEMDSGRRAPVQGPHIGRSLLYCGKKAGLWRRPERSSGVWARGYKSCCVVAIYFTTWRRRRLGGGVGTAFSPLDKKKLLLPRQSSVWQCRIRIKP